MTDVVSTLKRTTFIVQKEMAKNVALWQQNINTRSMNNVVAALDAVVTEIVDTHPKRAISVIHKEVTVNPAVLQAKSTLAE